MLGYEWLPVAGALVGLIAGLTGAGGGALMAPILLVGFGLGLATVVATDLLFVTITKLAVTRVHHKNQLNDWQVTKRLWLGDSSTAFNDAYALTELMQWVWRSRVRRGEPITFYLPSPRMRRPFEELLYSAKNKKNKR